MYQDDVDFLKQHTDAIVLTNQDGASLVTVPAYQGRVMTSATSHQGPGFGWINYEIVREGFQDTLSADDLRNKLYVFGGEERFWIGPEGGQFSSYFPKGSSFEFEDWDVPAFIDTKPWEVVEASGTKVSFRHREDVPNWSGNVWAMQIDRDVVLLETHALEAALGQAVPAGVKAVAHETVNRMSNAGETAWDDTTGKPSVWILGMMTPGPETNVVIPFVAGGDELGKAVTDDYFGKVPADRLVVDEDRGVLFFRADGKDRGKIGIGPQRSKGVAGSWDGLNKVLTIVQYNQPGPEVAEYVNSMWELQDEPFVGDAINSYNDGPVDGGQLGPFYEVETSSPALGLAAGESFTHIHRTIHLEGSEEALDPIARAVFGVSIAEIAGAV